MTTWLVYWESPACVGVLCYSPNFLSDLNLPESMQDQRVCKTRECTRQDIVLDKRVCKTRGEVGS